MTDLNLQQFKDDLSNSLYNMTTKEAIEKNICIQCKKPPQFYSEAGKKEYKISGLCEYCFDKNTEEF